MLHGLVEIPEELISAIIEEAAASHVLRHGASKAGFHYLLDDSSVAALSLTCQKIRRLALPVLFRSLRIAPGFLSEDISNGYAQEENMYYLVDALQTVNPWRIESVKHMEVLDCKGNLRTFVVDILAMFPALGQIRLPGQLWDDASVLNAIQDHPNLQRCIFPCIDWFTGSETVYLSYPDLHKIYWQSYKVDEGNISYLRRFLAAGLQIEILDITCMETDWTHLKFASTLRSICVIANVTEQCSLIWDFVDKHPSVHQLELIQDGPAVGMVERINPDIPSLLKDTSEPIFSLRSAVLVKTDDGDWRLNRARLEINYTDSKGPYLHDFSGKLRHFGHPSGVTHLLLLIVVPSDMSLSPDLSLDGVFKEAMSTMQNLKELSFMLSPATVANSKARHNGLPRQIRDEALKISHSIATVAPKLTQIDYLDCTAPAHAPMGGNQFTVLIERLPRLRVIKGNKVRDTVRRQDMFVEIESTSL